jgi:hypothetical protein
MDSFYAEEEGKKVKRRRRPLAGSGVSRLARILA